MNISTSERENSALISQFYSGDAESLNRLFAKYSTSLYAYIRSSVKDSCAAKDLLQDTYVKIYVSIKNSRYRDAGRFESWAFRIARNVVMDYFRDKKRAAVPLGDSYPFLAVDLPSERNELPQGLRQDLRDLLQRLPKPQREVVILRHYFGLSFQEIAQYTDVSINTALGRMRYALINMRKYAEEVEALCA